jgi:hypothetical protein
LELPKGERWLSAGAAMHNEDRRCGGQSHTYTLLALGVLRFDLLSVCTKLYID